MTRRRTRVLGAAVLALAVVGAVVGAGPGTDAAPSAAAQTSTRLVGVGHVAVAVPVAWGTNRTRCGTPVADSVLINQPSPVDACAVPRPPSIETVRIWRGTPGSGWAPARAIRVGGLPADRHDTTCEGAGPSLVCKGAIYIPSQDVSVLADSSTNAAEVDVVLGWVGVVPGRVGVPSYLDKVDRTKAAYVKELEREGLKVRLRTSKRSQWPSGYVLDVDPYPGTMVRAGRSVTVLVAA